MGLAPVQPDQALVDALSLDAAWQHAQDLEVQVANLRKLLANANKAWREQTEMHGKLIQDLWAVTEKYEPRVQGNPDLAQIVAELRELHWKGE